MPSKLATATLKRNRELCEPSPRFRFNFENVRRGGVQPDANAAKTAHPVARPLDVMALPGIEYGLHHGGQLAQKGRLAHRRQFASLRDFLKKLP
jgi:hypothetical protein